MTCGKCSMKLLSDITVEIGIFEISHEKKKKKKHEFLSNFNLGVNLSLAAGKYFIKNNF